MVASLNLLKSVLLAIEDGRQFRFAESIQYLWKSLLNKQLPLDLWDKSTGYI